MAEVSKKEFLYGHRLLTLNTDLHTQALQRKGVTRFTPQRDAERRKRNAFTKAEPRPGKPPGPQRGAYRPAETAPTPV